MSKEHSQTPNHEKWYRQVGQAMHAYQQEDSVMLNNPYIQPYEHHFSMPDMYSYDFTLCPGEEEANDKKPNIDSIVDYCAFKSMVLGMFLEDIVDHYLQYASKKQVSNMVSRF
jgi:hypothetical protein